MVCFLVRPAPSLRVSVLRPKPEQARGAAGGGRRCARAPPPAATWSKRSRRLRVQRRFRRAPAPRATASRERARPVRRGAARRWAGTALRRSRSVTVSPGASAARRQHRFSSSRTLPGQSCCSRRSQRVRLQALGRARRAACAASARKRSRQQRDVAACARAAAAAQAHHVEPVQQVGAEAAVGDARVEVLVGRGDHAHVDADQLASADAEELALGQHAQQSRLQRRRHVADLVEEQACRRRPARSGRRGACRRR